MTDRKIYQRFIRYMDNPVFGFTKSEHMISMIKAHISPKEAAFLIGFPFINTSLDEIAQMKGMDQKEALKNIKPLCNKAIIYEAINGDKIEYRLFSNLEMFLRPFHIKRDDPYKKMANLRNKYFMDGWHSQARHFEHPGTRAIPIHETIQNTKGVMPYEDIARVIDNYEYFSVSECACRNLHKHDPDFIESPFPSNVCLHFNEFGRFFDANGLGRTITREEALAILKEAADAGLVHAITNVEIGGEPGVICNCDLEYCVFFKPYHQLGFNKSVDKSNYVVSVTPKDCLACTLCAKRCPMDAIQMKFSRHATNKFRKAPLVDEELCIGCGVCVHKCKKKAITLTRRKETIPPPKDLAHMFMPNVMAVLDEKIKKEGRIKYTAMKSVAKLGWSLYEKSPDTVTRLAKFATNELGKRAGKKGKIR